MNTFMRLSAVLVLMLVSFASYAQRQMAFDPDRDPLSFALVIGIDNYRQDRLPPLEYTRSDADAVASRLDFLGYNVSFLTNRDATRERILTELASIRSMMAPQDRFILYFAGYTVLDVWSDGLYVVAYDSDIEKIAFSGVALREIVDYTNRIESYQKLILLDNAAVATEQIQPDELEYYVRDYLEYGLGKSIAAEGDITIVASVSSQRMVLGERRQSAMTAALLDALDTAFADTDRNELLSIQELLEYLDYETLELAYDSGYEYPPQIFIQSRGWNDWPVASIAGTDDVADLAFAEKQRDLLAEALSRLATDKSISLRTRLTFESLLNRWVDSMNLGRSLTDAEEYALDESIYILSSRYSDRDKARMLESLESDAFGEIRLQAPQQLQLR